MSFSRLYDRLTKEHNEAKKKMDDKSIEADKKTFLKAQIPKMESEIKDVKKKLEDLLESEELDPRGEFYLLAEKLVK
jgi:formate-dependent nitrite reductase cytochrome c552 subunit